MAQLNVFMDGDRCGTLEQTNTGDLRFTYDDEYLANPTVTPLSLSMPISRREHRKRVVLPFLDGLLPDNEMARRAIGQRYAVSPNNPFALLAHIGADVAGALQILPPGIESSDQTQPRGSVRALSESDVIEATNATVSQYRHGGGVPGDTSRFSLAGAQPKLALCRTNHGGWGAPEGSTPTTHIIKPQSTDFDRLDLVEFMTMRSAAWLGLNVATTWLETFGDWPAIVVQRYDRAFTGHQWHRLHQEDLAQALGVASARKYQYQDGGPGVGDAARVFRGLARPVNRQEVAWRFFQGLAFNAVFRCTDAHAKNYSLLLNGSQVTMAPLYDLASIVPYDTESQRAFSAMKVGNHYRFASITDGDFAKAASILGLEEVRALDYVIDLKHRRRDAVEAARDEVVANDKRNQPKVDTILARFLTAWN